MIEKIESQNILISGASGNIGRALTSNLLTNGHNVICLTTNRKNLLNLNCNTKALSFVEVENWSDVAPFVSTKIDTFVHLSGQTSSYVARENFVQDLKTNLLSLAQITKYILENQHQIKRVILASSMTQYGVVSSLPIDEQFPTTSPTFYEMGKNFNEILIEHLAMENKVNSFNFLRLSNVYGSVSKVQENRGFIDKSVEKAILGQPLYYFGSGDYVRDYIYIDDVVNAFVKNIQVDSSVYNGPYNIGSGQGISIKDALEMVSEKAGKYFGNYSPVLEREFPERSYDIERRNSVADSTLFTSQTGWKPKTTFENGLIEIIKRNIK